MRGGGTEASEGGREGEWEGGGRVGRGSEGARKRKGEIEREEER